MNVLDLALLGVAGVFAVNGLRHGLVVALGSLVGFVAGASLGLVALPRLLGASRPGTVRALLALALVLGAGVAGQMVGGMLARKLRRVIVWGPVRAVDAVGGALVNVLAVLLVAWVLGSSLVRVDASPALADEARSSVLLGEVNRLMPAPPDRVFAAFGALLDDAGFPAVFTDPALERVFPVGPGSAALLAAPGVRAAELSVVKVRGLAPSCSRQIEGSGYVYAPDLVITNAHVLAGVVSPRVYVGGDGWGYPATVVYFDPRVDVAVLSVPRLGLPVLRLGTGLSRGASGVVAGYPGDGPLDLQPARVRGQVLAAGSDVYGQSAVTRDVLALRARVRPGNSGGPLVDAAGTVQGLVFAASTADADTGYALTVAELGAAAAAGRTATAAVGTGGCAP